MDAPYIEILLYGKQNIKYRMQELLPVFSDLECIFRKNAADCNNKVETYIV